ISEATIFTSKEHPATASSSLMSTVSKNCCVFEASTSTSMKSSNEIPPAAVISKPPCCSSNTHLAPLPVPSHFHNLTAERRSASGVTGHPATSTSKSKD